MNDNVKRQNLKVNLAILFLVVVILVAVLMGAYALYTTTQNNSVNVSIASWQFKVDGNLQTSDEMDFAMTRLDNNDKVVKGVLAPETYGEFPIYWC